MRGEFACKLRLAVFFESKLHSGGGYQQELNAISHLRSLPNEVEFVVFTPHHENLEVLEGDGYEVRSLELPFASRQIARLYRFTSHPKIFKLFNKLFRSSPLEQILAKENIDVVYFTSPSSYVLDLDATNFIYTVWDLCHRDEPEFPEVRQGRQFETRDKKLERALPKATAILVDSEAGRKNLIEKFKVAPSRVIVQRFSAGQHIDDSESSAISRERARDLISDGFGITDPFIFYPAQLWPHKNHAVIIYAMKLLVDDYGLDIQAVFSGADKGNGEYLKKLAKRLGVSENIKFLGFVSGEEMSNLYRAAISLIMPTYFGPTNLPPLEAFKLGTPVICSDLPGTREIAGDAACYFDFGDTTQLAQYVYALINDGEYMREKQTRSENAGKAIAALDRSQGLSAALARFSWQRVCWGESYPSKKSC